jgi:mRNA-degrading endonuclease RelE of RelBE toxin-antitoxin system
VTAPTVILHRTLLCQLRGFCKLNPKEEGAVCKALEKLVADPFHAGRPMKGISRPELQGSIYRLHVGGPSGYRLIYYIHRRKTPTSAVVVIPIFFSQVPRSRFDYHDLDLDSLGQAILSDFQNNVVTAFVRFTSAALLDG